MSRRISPNIAILGMALMLGAHSMLAQSGKHSSTNAGAAEGDFFIVSSIDIGKKELLVKLPTEVTQIVQVDDKTHYLDNDGKAIGVSDLRAGDTVYITFTRAGRISMAVTIHKGPMTIQELHRRYVPPTP